MKALDLANYILTVCKNKSISNLHLQKILYFVNAYYLGKTGNFLIKNDFQAWQHGPVIPEVYNRFSYLGSQSISLDDDEKIECISNKEDGNGGSIGKEMGQALKEIILILADKDPWTLVRYSHAEDGAWYKTFHNKGQWMPIDSELIKKEADKYARQ
nr:MAG TPA: hypothetical protein [Caudoviricetes sp.]